MSTNNTSPPAVANNPGPAAAAAAAAPNSVMASTAATPATSVPASAGSASNGPVPVSTAAASNSLVSASTATTSISSIPAPTAADTVSNGTDQDQEESQQNPATPIAGGEPATADLDQQETNRLLRPEPLQQRQLGLRQFFNNKKLSDVKIRFGAQGERVFHGHKVVLASVSLWFHAAFTNSNFIEAGAHELTLQGDDDEALLQMLQACYLPNNKYHHMPPWSAEQMAASKSSNKIVLFHISVYTVVDKYQAPRIREAVLLHIRNWLRGAFNFTQVRGGIPPTVEVVGLRGIVEKVYGITGHVDLDEPLRKTLLDVIMEHPATKPINIKPGTLAGEVVKAAGDIPDFGRDMFLRTMQAVPATVPNKKSFLAVIEQITCGHCGRVWSRVIANSPPRCIHCGQ